MGAGIAQVAAASGYRTIVREVDQALLAKGLARIRKFLDDGVAKGKVTAEQRERTVGNLTGTTDLAAMKDADLVIEAIIENVDDKASAYTVLDAVVGAQTIFASNTSSIRPTTSPTSCSTSTRTRCLPHPRCSSGWCWPARPAGRARLCRTRV
jgi:3-hydroxybutyryl-CoA dehydrogenase